MGKDNLSIYAGTVRTSFDYIIIPTRGNWVQTNPLQHESDDWAGNTVSCACVTNGKDMALQCQILSTFVSAFGSVKPTLKDRAVILVFVRVLRVRISKIY